MDNELINLLKSKSIGLKDFDHFDYIETLEIIDGLSTNPRKKKIIEEFITKCEEVAIEDNKKQNNHRWKNFMNRMQLM